MIRFGKLVRCFAGFSRNLTAHPLSNENTQKISISRNNFTSLSSLAINVNDYDLDNQIKKIDQSVRKTGRISIKELEEILEEIRSKKQHVSSSQSLLLLRCCGSLVPEESLEVRTQFTKEIWETLNALDVPMDISHYNALLRVYLENEYLFSPIDFLENLKLKGVEPNRVTYQRLIMRYCQQGDLDGATLILKFMQEKILPINEHVFNALIIGHSQANDIKSSKGILSVMKQAGLEPSSESYVTLMCCFAKHGLIEDIISTIDECSSKNILVADKDLLEIVYNLSINFHTNHISDILKKIQKGRGFNQDCINVILRLISRQQDNVAYEIFKIMPRAVDDNGDYSDTGSFFIKQMVKSSRPISKIIDFCSDMKTQKYNTKSFEVAYEAAIAYNSLDTLTLLKAMKENNIEIRQHFFWPILCKTNNENELCEMVSQIKSDFGVQLSSETIRDYIIPNLNENSPDKIIELLSQAYIPQSIAAISTANWTLRNNNLKETLHIFENYKTNYPITMFKNQLVASLVKTEDVLSFVKILKNICLNIKSIDAAKEFVGEMTLDALNQLKTKSSHMIPLLLESLLHHNLGISEKFTEIIQSKLEHKVDENISNLLIKLASIDLKLSRPNINDKYKNMSLEELESLIQKDKVLSKDNHLRRHLINACIESKDLNKIENVLSFLQRDGFDIPNGSKAQLIELYCNSNELDKALNLYEKENETKEFRLDQLKTIKLVDLVLKSGDTEKAINILIENRGKTINEEESYLYKNNIWKLLNNLSETGNVEVLNKVFDVLEKNNYIIRSNIVLGPLIKVHLKNNNLSCAMETFTEICEKYRLTPWKNELSCRFIQNEDAESLQKLTDLSTTIHGEVNSLYDLVFSFIECGRIRQARQILETPGLKNRSNRISNACERYKNDGNIKSLEAMIEATRDINYIDRNFIYFNLLQSYEKENDHQKALNLWTRMQEENIVPSDTFLIKLGKLLKENNINVPFTIPSSSKKSENIEKSTKLKIVNDPKLKTIDLYNKFEGLLKENKISEASIMFNNFINKTNNIPRRLLKFYINKLASIGDYESIEKMVLSDEIKKKISFDNRLCHAYIKADKVNDYFIKLREDLENCKSIGEIQDKGAAFPRGGALGILENFPDMYEEYKVLAEKYAMHNIKGPMNVLWIHCIIKENIEEANNIFEKHLKSENRLMFQKVLQEARETNNENILNALISSLKDSKISEGALGNIYSCLLDILTKQDKTSDAVSVLNEGLKNICLENFNRTALVRLQKQCVEKGISFPHIIKGNLNSSSSSSSSSDDDIVEPKPK